jgi:hypothetical protein
MKTETLTIGALKFIEQQKPERRGGPRCVLSTNAKQRGELRFNAVLLDQFPELRTTERVTVFLASGEKPAVVLVPAAEGASVRGERSGAMKVTGIALRALALKYRRILYKVEAIETPRKGWLLSPMESERI